MSRIVITTLLSLAAWSAHASVPVDCSKLLADSRDAMLQLDYQAFDQTEGQGFRLLAKAGCTAEAADLIEQYIAHTGATQSSLTWHIAQLRAESGQTQAALVAARKVLRDEPADAPFKWNDYVSAVIAFLEKDRAAFGHHLGRVLAASELHAGNAMNGKLLQRLELGFGGSYMDALKANP